MIRNPWRWLRRLESVMVSHMAELSDIRKWLRDQGEFNHTQHADIGKLDARLRRLETMQFGYGTPSKSIPLDSYETERKDC